MKQSKSKTKSSSDESEQSQDNCSSTASKTRRGGKGKGKTKKVSPPTHPADAAPVAAVSNAAAETMTSLTNKIKSLEQQLQLYSQQAQVSQNNNANVGLSDNQNRSRGRGRGNRQVSQRGNCYNCGRQGHVASQCRAPRVHQPQYIAPSVVQAPFPPPAFVDPRYQYTQMPQQQQYVLPSAPSHHQPTQARSVGQEMTTSVDASRTSETNKNESEIDSDDEYVNLATYIQMRLDGRTLYAEIDTGAKVNIVPPSLTAGYNVRPCKRVLECANQTKMSVEGKVTLPVQVNGKICQLNAVVSNQTNDILLGLPFLAKHQVIPDVKTGTALINGDKVKLHSRPNSSWCRRVILANDVQLAPHAERLVPANIQFNGNPRLGFETWINNISYPVQGVCVARSVLPRRTMGIPIRLINVTNKPISLLSGLALATLEPVTLCADQSDDDLVDGQQCTSAVNSETGGVLHAAPSLTASAVHGTTVDSLVYNQSGDIQVKSQFLPDNNSSNQTVKPETEQLIEDLVSRVDPSVPAKYREQLRKLLRKYQQILSPTDKIGEIPNVEHVINTGSAAPFRQRLRRHPPAHEEIIEQEVAKLLQQGIITPSSSPYCSNVVLARKRDSTWRMCVDHRQLNELTASDPYPPPNAQVCFDSMTGAKWYSGLDVTMAFHTVKSRREDQPKTQFVTKSGTYSFQRMSFGLKTAPASCGLKNAPASWSRAIDMVLSGLAPAICMAYMDDIVCGSQTISEMLDRLELIFQRLAQHNLTLKVSKCMLLQRKISWLGHELSAEGIGTCPEKVKAVTEWPVPHDVHALKSFLGLTGYYRRYIKGYAEVTHPLTQLLKHDTKFIWTDECQAAFNQLKCSLTTSPILTLPKFDRGYILDTDASAHSIGAVLSQISDDGHERVIAYASRKLTETEQNYCATRRELLAALYYLKYFRVYLLGPYTSRLRTDHAALLWLKHLKQPIGQQARWLEILSEFDQVTFEHRAGLRHGNADALSRRLCDRPRCCKPELIDLVNEYTATLHSTEIAPVDNLPVCAVQSNSISLDMNRALIAAEQDLDPELLAIKHSILGGYKIPGNDILAWSKDSKAIYNQVDRLLVDRNGILCRNFVNVDSADYLQSVMPKSLRANFLRELHVAQSHLGRKRLQAAVRLRAYWPGWSQSVNDLFKRCPQCASFKRGKLEPRTPLRPIVAGDKWEVISIDIAGPFPTCRNYRYILAVQDLFSKYVLLCPLKQITAEAVADFLVHQVFKIFAYPAVILSDQGKQFDGHLFHAICDFAGVTKVRSSPYEARTNGQIERLNRTVHSMMGKLVQSNQKDWVDHLSSIQLAYNTTVQSTTGLTPHKIIFGTEARLSLGYRT